MTDETKPPESQATPPRAVDWSTIGKYGMGALIFGSLYYLVLLGKMPVDEFLSLATAALAALGYHVASK